MSLGLTISRGREQADTVETGTLTREAGQYDEYASCPVRAGQDVELVAPTGMTATRGGVVIYFDPDNDSDAAGQASFGHLFSWRADADNLIRAFYSKASARFEVRREAAGVETGPVVLDTFVAGDAKALYVAWDSTTIYIAVDGGSIASTPNAHIPTLPTDLHIGSLTGGNEFSAAYGAVLLLDGPITQTQWAALAKLRSTRPPLLGEVVHASMLGLWYGAHGLYWTLPGTGDALDLMGYKGLTVERLHGAGVAPIEHRAATSPLRDGAVLVDSLHVPRVLEIELAVYETSARSWWEVRRRLAQAANPRRGLGLLQFAPEGLVYEIGAVLDGGLAYASTVARLARSIARFWCPDFAWQDAVVAEQTIDPSAGGLAVPLVVPAVIEAAEATATVSNAGDLESWPEALITIEDDDTQRPFVEHLAEHRLMAITGSHAGGDEITIDMDARTIVDADGDSLFGRRSTDSRAWALQPGDNEIKAGAGQGDVSVRLRWHTRYAGV